MSFKISARTILQLGAELISSDAVAIYELVKNSIDARSKSGVDVLFEIVIKHGDFATAANQVEAYLHPEQGIPAHELAPANALEFFRNSFLLKINPDAPINLRQQFESAIKSAPSIETLLINATQAYSDCNRIVVEDTGEGMSLNDLRDIFLTIGTTNRTNAVRTAITQQDTKSPYLGEKGVGRLSVMRLGWKVVIESATAQDTATNVLEIDWRKFEDAYDADASSVILTPIKGHAKPVGESFTRITITGIRSTWTSTRLKEISKLQIARMMDPFSWSEPKRFAINLKFNGTLIEQSRTVAKALLDKAHSKCAGSFSFETGSPILTVRFESSLYEQQTDEHCFDLTDLIGMSGIHDHGLPTSTLRTLGAFEFEFYWFNRQRLRGYPDIGELPAVRDLVRQWAGICLFRDGYRVLPYGDEGDDWLGLDIDALGSQGYKLNTKQIIGRVTIGRTSNSRLVDQTNRQGLTDTPEKSALIRLLRNLISYRWRNYLNDAMNAQKVKTRVAFDTPAETSAVDVLQERATTSLNSIREDFKGDARLLREVKDAFTEIKDAHRRAVERIEAIEEQKERLTQLAGVGLLVEMIAHELTRATELTQATLKNLNSKKIDSETTAAFSVLGQQIKVIQKRLQTLEPLSITARQRRSQQKVSRIVDYVLEAHVAQFERHSISASHLPISKSETQGFIIEGHIVQILENLISNSVYWLDVQRREHPAFKAIIDIWIDSNPPAIFYRDNGPGIPASRVETVFEPFFSTRSGSSSRRQGLGLYIARQTAEMLGGTLDLVNVDEVRPGRYNTFKLELKEGAH